MSNNGDDLFGDDSFLDDFDTDAAVKAAAQRPIDAIKNNLCNNTQGRDVPQSSNRYNPYKKIKKDPSLQSPSIAVGTKTESSDFYSGPPPSSSSSVFPKQERLSQEKKNLVQSTLVQSNLMYNNSNRINNNEAYNAENVGGLHNTAFYEGEDNEDIPADLEASLTSTIRRYFGHSCYRPGQLNVLNALLRKRDVAVFWSTGSGKSMCYQIPPLHLNKIAIVVSPLISLMEDQVSKLNGLLATDDNYKVKNNDIAAYLGSGQKDPTVEERVLRGEYRLVYCTPEKLCAESSGFLNALGKLHQQGNHNSKDGGNICLIAVDESHCVSEWGHDFRPSYRKVGEKIRSHSALRGIPLLALTATAIPRVQSDIIRSLRMESPKISKQSIDRDNLIISVHRKPPGGYQAALQGFVDELLGKMKCGKRLQQTQQQKMSTIIYCPTQKTVETVAIWMSEQFAYHGNNKICVQPYHGGMSMDDRTDSHTNFLIGRTTVIVATIAFGMGIDKPDTRRIIHYGPPKTIEEYFQQIGRAGRDGLDAQCTMYCDSSDFSRYSSDFYLGKLSGEVKKHQERGITAMRQYAMGDEHCRRAQLLRFFGETPAFGEWCGNCDICRMRKTHKDDLERDFADDGAMLVLYVLDILNGKQGLSVIEKLINGNSVETYRLKNRNTLATAKKKIAALRRGGDEEGGRKKRKRAIAYYTKELLPALEQRGYVEQKTQHISIPGQRFTKSFASYDLTSKGRKTLSNPGALIVLPVPASMRESERREKEKIEKTLKILKESGVDIEQIPKTELEDGEGEVLVALRRWYSYIDQLRRGNRLDRVDQLDDLRLRIEAWRSDMAVRYRMAPSAVMAEHLLVKVAYTAASLPPNMAMAREALIAAGVRSGGIDDLVQALGEWKQGIQAQLTQMQEGVSGGSTGKTDSYDGNGFQSPSKSSSSSDTIDLSKSTMILSDEPFELPNGPWKYFVYRPKKNTGMAAWESSYRRFCDGDHPQTIAMTPLNGRPIQVATVLSHIWDGIVYGGGPWSKKNNKGGISLKKLSTFSIPPTAFEWDRLCRMEAETDIDVTADPATSGPGGEMFRIGDILRPEMGETFSSKEYQERTEQEKAKFLKWCGLLKWYTTMRRVGYEPGFTKLSSSGKSSVSRNVKREDDDDVMVLDC